MTPRTPTRAGRCGRGRAAARRGERGMTLVEILIATGILAGMMVIAWTTIDSSVDAKRYYEGVQERNHEIRIAMNRMARDISSAYLSANENKELNDRRTLFVGKSGGTVDELRFSSMGHRVLWADANESEQTLITYLAEPDRDDPGKTNLLRRESRRLSNEQWESEPAEVDLLLRDIERVEFEYWNWKDNEWQPSWDSVGADAEKDRVPERVRITITVNVGEDTERTERKYTTQARVMMQEQLQF